MTIEIISMEIVKNTRGLVRMTALDISEERMMYMERRDDGFESELTYEWDTADHYQRNALKKFLKKQNASKGKKTWGEVLKAVEGTVTESPSGRYRVWEY